MIDRARAFDSHRRCQFVLNSNPDLRIFAAKHFDFVYSSITLQHIKPRFTRLYLREFARVLRPGGVLVFQLPSRMRGGGAARLWCRRLLHRAYRDLYRPIFNSQTPRIDMHGIEQNEVIRTLQTHALKVVESVPDWSAGPLWETYRYLATKPEEVVT
jgi:ubiquinone/menaquinone biosynthesis C-methylase UbiE